MKHSLLLLFFLAFIGSSFAQVAAIQDYSIAQIDSLLEVFKTEKAYDKFLPYAQVGAEKAAKQYGNQDTTYAKMLYFLGFGSQVTRDFANAAKYFQQAIDIQKIKMPKSPKYANTLHNLAILYHSMGNFPLAETLYKESLQIRKEVLGTKHLDYSNSLNNFAALYKDMGNYPTAIPMYKEALNIRKKVLGEKHPDYANSLNNLAGLYYMMGNSALAAPLFKEAALIKKAVLGEKHPEYAGNLNNLGTFYRGIGDYASAEYYYKEALNIYKEVLSDKNPDYAMLLSNMAGFYVEISNYALSEPLYKEALKIRKETVGEKHPEYATNLINLGLLYSIMGNYPAAESLYKESLTLRKETLGEKHPDYAANLNRLAILYQKMERYTMSEPLFLEALKIQKTVLGNQHPEYAMNLNNLAGLYTDMGSFLLAEPLYKEAIQIQKEVLGDKHPHYAASLNNLAELYRKMGDYKNAWAFVQQSLSAYSGLNTSLSISDLWADSLYAVEYDIPEFVQTLAHVYELLAMDTLQQSAVFKNRQIIVADLALKLLQKSRNVFLDDADKLRTLTESSDWVLRGLTAVDKQTQAEKAFAFAEQSKSVLLLDAVQTAMAQNFGDLPDSLIQKELTLQKKRSECEAGLLEKRPESEKDYLRTLLNKVNFDIKDLKSTIEKSFPKYAALKYQQKEASVSEIQKLLNSHASKSTTSMRSDLAAGKTALLEYVIGDSMVYIFYVDDQNIQLIEHPISKAALTSKIKKLHHALSDYDFILQKGADAYQEYTENAHWFYKNLVQPALDKKQKINNLIIITDGELGFLPFESFLVKQAPQGQTDYNQLHYLINDYAISYNYSATLWKSNKSSKKNSNNGQLLGMVANYDSKIDTSTTELSTKNNGRMPIYQRLRAMLVPLPAAQKEVETLEGTFKGFFAFDKDASEKKFKEKAGDYAVIHLAMHGLLDENAPILSSLAFTEDGDSLENNFLQAFEISKMKLNADLVVLSACETGYGRFEKGNGLASLARAFMYAGAPAMVVSLWQVNDYSTSIIMQNFYTNLSEGMAKDKALQQAKLQYIQIAKDIATHPAFWSPFVQIGNTDAIYLETEGGYFWWVVGGVVVLGGIALAIGRKKSE